MPAPWLHAMDTTTNAIYSRKALRQEHKRIDQYQHCRKWGWTAGGLHLSSIQWERPKKALVADWKGCWVTAKLIAFISHQIRHSTVYLYLPRIFIKTGAVQLSLNLDYKEKFLKLKYICTTFRAKSYGELKLNWSPLWAVYNSFNQKNNPYSALKYECKQSVLTSNLECNKALNLHPALLWMNIRDRFRKH